jgi:lactaldehyde reductase
MAHPLGAFYNIPHGVANAVLLPYIMEFNAESTGDKYRDIAKAMGLKDILNQPIQEVRKYVVEAVKQLNKDVGIPAKLRDIGVQEQDIPELAQAAFADVCTSGNPREVNVKDIEMLYHHVY